MLNPETRASLSEVFPDLFAIGTDAGGQVLAYDMTRPHPWPIVMHLPGYTDATNRPTIAVSMHEFMKMYFP